MANNAKRLCLVAGLERMTTGIVAMRLTMQVDINIV